MPPAAQSIKWIVIITSTHPPLPLTESKQFGAGRKARAESGARHHFSDKPGESAGRSSH